MKYQKTILSSLSLILLLLFTCNFLKTPLQASGPASTFGSDPIHSKALEVLEQRCNTCHRKQNPFRIFKEKNLEKYAPLIYQQVFELKRMPKDGSTLSQSEQEALLDLIEMAKSRKEK